MLEKYSHFIVAVPRSTLFPMEPSRVTLYLVVLLCSFPLSFWLSILAFQVGCVVSLDTNTSIPFITEIFLGVRPF